VTRRAHAAAATRRLVAGVATAATLGIVAALGITGTRTSAANSRPSQVVETTPATIVRTVYRYVEVPADGAAPSSGRTATGGTSATPAPASRPAPKPVTSTKGS